MVISLYKALIACKQKRNISKQKLKKNKLGEKLQCLHNQQKE